MKETGASTSARKSSIAVLTPLRGPPAVSALCDPAFRPPPFTSVGFAHHHPAPAGGLAVLLRDRVGEVVHVAVRVREVDVVHEGQREGLAVLGRDARDRLQLVVDRVPVVVAVDQHGVGAADLGQHLEAESAVEHEALAELALQSFEVEVVLRRGVDGVHGRAAVLRRAQRKLGDRAAVHADLDHEIRLCGGEQRRDYRAVTEHRSMVSAA